VLTLTERHRLTEAGMQMFEVRKETALSSNNCKTNYEVACLFAYLLWGDSVG